MAKIKSVGEKTLLPGELARFKLCCRECGRRFAHRQSLSRHRKHVHKTASVTASSTADGVSPLHTPLFVGADESFQAFWSQIFVEPQASQELMEPAPSHSQPPPADQPPPVTSVVASSVHPRLAAPRKRPHVPTELDRRAGSWPALPAVSTADLYEVVRSMPDIAPSKLADVIVRRYSLGPKKKTVLTRRLAAISYARSAMKREIRELLPIAELDGDSAVGAVRRVAAWLQGGGAPDARPFE